VQATHSTDDGRVLDWLKRTSAVPDHAVLVSSLRADCLAIGPSGTAASIEVVAEGADAGLRDHAHLLLMLAIALEDDGMRACKREAGVLAQLRGEFAARDLLLREPIDAQGDDKAKVPIAQMLGRAVTLGERKSLARGRQRAVLDRVLRDPSPDVIRLVLANPAVTEADVIRLVARRPGVADVLREVFIALRFILRMDVRVSLVKNPRTPTDLSLAVLRTIPRGHVEEVATLADVPVSVRDLARRIIARQPLH
jgi:hypothetical protein